MRVSITGGVAVLAGILLSPNEAVAVVYSPVGRYIAEVLEEEEAKQLEPERAIAGHEPRAEPQF